MKNLKLFESNWNENKLKRVLRETEKICDLIKEFIIIEKFPNAEDIKNVTKFYFEKMPEFDSDIIIVELSFNNDAEYNKEEEYILIDDIDKLKLYSFMENTEEYKKIIKYNI